MERTGIEPVTFGCKADATAPTGDDGRRLSSVLMRASAVPSQVFWLASQRAISPV